MTLLSSVNALRSSATPQLKGRPSSRASDHYSATKESSRRSEYAQDSDSRSSAARDERYRNFPIKGSSSFRRDNADAAKPSNNPFSRLVSSGDMPSSNNPFSRKESSGGLHRSNTDASTAHSKRSATHDSSHVPSERPSSLTSTGPDYPYHSSSRSYPVGLTRSYSSSTARSSNTAPPSLKLDSNSGALVPLQRSQTVSSRPSSRSPADYQLTRPSSRDLLPPPPARATQGASTAPSILSQGSGHVTLNITNINVNSHNTGGSASRDPMVGFAEMDFETRTGGVNVGRGGSGRFEELGDDLEEYRYETLAEKRARVQSEIDDVEEQLYRACTEYSSRR